MEVNERGKYGWSDISEIAKWICEKIEWIGEKVSFRETPTPGMEFLYKRKCFCCKKSFSYINKCTLYILLKNVPSCKRKSWFLCFLCFFHAMWFFYPVCSCSRTTIRCTTRGKPFDGDFGESFSRVSLLNKEFFFLV